MPVGPVREPVVPPAPAVAPWPMASLPVLFGAVAAFSPIAARPLLAPAVSVPVGPLRDPVVPPAPVVDPVVPLAVIDPLAMAFDAPVDPIAFEAP